MQEGEVVAERFVIESLAGTGGMGAVYRALDIATGQRVALKLLLEDGNDLRFDREARVLAELDHPAIVRYVAHGRTQAHRPFIAMDWLEGEDLKARLARGRLSIAQVVALAQRVAAALAAAHQRGVVHRDIKPANLFLPMGDPDRAVVLDFGIARSSVARALETTQSRVTHTGLVMGTVGYMSPEQACGASEVDASTDVFALGCVLFECLTGRPAFMGANAVAVLAKLLLEDAPRARHFESSIPVPLDDLVASMLAKNVGARLPDGRALLAALDAADFSRRTGSSSGAGGREQRLATVLLARGVDAASARARVDGPLVELADGTLLFEFHGTDPATRAAVCALALAGAAEGASLAIATGRVSAEHAYGPIIDRVAALQREVGIAVDEVSASLLGDRFEISGRRLIGPSRSPLAPRTLLGRPTPCVGRDKEIALLEATFRECVDEPVARAVTVTGVAGSGKTRLAQEVLGRVGADAYTLIARGDPVGAGSALGVARQLVRSAAGLLAGESTDLQRALLERHLAKFFCDDVLSDIGEMLAELVGLSPPNASPQLRAARDDPRILAAWLAKSFGQWLGALCDSGPVLCLIEDLHWGDAASVAYLDDALQSNAARPLMVLALARPEVHELFPSLWARSNAQEIRLSALTRRAAERLVGLAIPGAPSDVVDRIVARADGNAFRLEELIRHVVEHGDDTLPETVLALAEARLSYLDPEARRVLRVASVFGETFWEEGLSSLLGDGTDVDAVLQRLVMTEVVVQSSGRKLAGGEFVYRHGILRDAAYAMLDGADKVELHRRAADWLERREQHDPLVLAEHLEKAEQPLRAAPFYLRAAQMAGEGMELSRVEALVERGVRSGASGEVLGGLRVVQTLAAVGKGDHARAAGCAKEAYALLPERTAQRYLAASLAVSSGAAVGDLLLAPVIVQEVLTTTPVGPPNGPYGLAIRTVCDLLDTVGQTESVERLLDNADALAARTPGCDHAFLANVGFARTAMMLRHDGDLGRVLETAARGRAYGGAVGDRMTLIFYDYGWAVLRFEIGEIEPARDSLVLSERRFREHGASLFATWCALQAAWASYFLGRHREALAMTEPAFETVDHRHAYALAALARLEIGDFAAAEHYSALVVSDIDHAILPSFIVATARTARARVALAAGRLEEAETQIDLAQIAVSQGATPSIATLFDCTRIEVLRARGKEAEASLICAAARRRLERHAASLDEGQRRTFLERGPGCARLLAMAQTP